MAVAEAIASLSGDDLEVALRRARRLEVGPLFAKELLALDAPAEVHTAAAGIYRENLARNLFLKAETDSWVSALEAAGIPCRVLKGVYLSELLYSDLGAKSCADIDLLVRREDLDGAMDVAAVRGFRLADPTSGGPDDTDAKAYTLESTGDRRVPYFVDLHWELEVPMLISLGQEDFWHAPGARAPGGAMCDCAPEVPADLLGAFLCLHLWHHSMSLKALVDFAAFVRRYDEAMPGVEARFKRTRARDGVALALILVCRVFGVRSCVLDHRHPKRLVLPWLESCAHLSVEARGRYLNVLVSPLRLEGFLLPFAATARYLFRSGARDGGLRLRARVTRFGSSLSRAASGGPLFTQRKVDHAKLV